MARRQRNSHLRRVNGILLLDKPAGLTSNAALQVVKKLYRARKAGHTGSLVEQQDAVDLSQVSVALTSTHS